MRKRQVIGALFALGFLGATAWNGYDAVSEFNSFRESRPTVIASETVGDENLNSWRDFIPLARAGANTVGTALATYVIANKAFPDAPKKEFDASE